MADDAAGDFVTRAQYDALVEVVEDLMEQVEALKARAVEMDAVQKRMEEEANQYRTNEVEREEQRRRDVAASISSLEAELARRALRVEWDLIDTPVVLGSNVKANKTINLSNVADPGNWVRILIFVHQSNAVSGGRLAKLEARDGGGVVVSRGWIKISGSGPRQVFSPAKGILGGGKQSISFPTVVQSTVELMLAPDNASLHFQIVNGKGGAVVYTILCEAVGIEA